MSNSRQDRRRSGALGGDGDPRKEETGESFPEELDEDCQPGKTEEECQPGKADVRVCYQRHLPHQVPQGFPIFLTWNLKASLPQRVLQQLEREQQRLDKEPKRLGESASERKVRHGKILFAKRDGHLDAACGEAYVRLSRLTGEHRLNDVRLESLTYEGRPMWLADPRAASEVVRSIVWGVEQRYELFACAVLGNHVHVLLTPRVALEITTQGIKGYTAYQINQIHKARGRTFWQDESYDHWARDEEELFRIVEYIENNPVVAGLCPRPEAWPWSSAFWRNKLNWQAGEPFRPEWKETVRQAVQSTLGFPA